jgi:hypothetical protein
MGILVDFEEAKAKLVNRQNTTEPLSTDSQLTTAIETFAFSRLEKRNRVALVLAGIFGGEAEQYLLRADEIIWYANVDFAIPYTPRKLAIDLTAEDIKS